MTVSTEISSNEYTGNGVTTDFDYKFRIFKANQLSVITSDADGDNVVTLRLGTDYTVTGANKSAGGKVILAKPLADGHKISIARDIPIKQETSFRNQSKFFAETHEDAFDYLTMILQRIWGSLGSLYLKRPNILANWFDAKGYRIANLGKPKRDSDAVDLGTLKDEISDVNSTILKREKNLLRVDDMDIAALPKAAERAGNVLTFDKDGKPIVVAPATGSAVDVLNQLSKNTGAELVGTSTGVTVEDRFKSNENEITSTKKGRNPRYLKIRHVISHEQQRIQPVIDRYNYTFFGQQGLYVDTIDNKLYITYQSISDTNKWVWVVVFDWLTGEYLYRFSTDADGAPEGIAIIHDGNSRYMLLPEYQNSRTFRYTLPAVIAEDTHLIHDAEFSTGSKYQLGNYKNRIAISRDIGGANHGFDYDGNRVDIYSTSGFITGNLTRYSSLSLDNSLQGRAGEKPKRQGLTMGQNSILASVGAYTPTSGYKPSGLYGYLEYNLDGSLKNNAIFSPAEFADKLVAAGYERLKTIENESICLADENEIPEIFTCAIGAMGDKTDSQRSVIIIQHNCLGGDDVIDMSSSAGANVNFYNDLPSSYHTLNNDNPLSGALFTKVSDICEFMITYDVSNYTLMTTSEITLDTSARVKIGIGSLLTVTSINKNIFKVEWVGKSQATGVVTSSVGNILLRKSENYEITNLSFNLLQNSPMPPFAGDASYSVVGCPLWSPVGGGNGVLMESGYAWNRTFQRFIDVAGNLYIRYADDVTRNTTTGWKKYTSSNL
nr:hypothetical protein [Providencia rettgeri]